MKKWAVWTVGGFGVSLVCGLGGLAHLSATFATLTVFCATWALVMIGVDAWMAQRERST